MNWADYLIPASCPSGKYGCFGDHVLTYRGEPEFRMPDLTKVAIIGIPEDRFSEGAGEIKSPGVIRKQLYALSAGSKGTVVDLGNLRTGKTLVDTYFGMRDILSELYRQGIVTLLVGGTLDLFYGNYLAMEGQKVVLTTVSPQLRFSQRAAEKHPLNALMFEQTDAPVHICNVGYQSYYVSQQDSDYFIDRHFEAYRLGEVRESNLRGCEPVIRDSDLIAVSLEAVKFSDAPAASNVSPNGFTGEEICQVAFYAGLSHRCRSLGLFDMIPQNDIQDITAMLSAQMAWYFIEGVKKRNRVNPTDHADDFKKYVIYLDQLHHNLCFYKSMETERWWMEVPSISNKSEGVIISCTAEDYSKAAEQEIPDRWWKTYQRIN